MSNEVPQELLNALPGATGSLIGVVLMRGVQWGRRIGMFLGGAGLAYWGSPWAAKAAQLEPGFAGFLLGLLGMRLVSKVIDTWDALELGTLLRDVIRKWFGLAPIADAPPPSILPPTQEP